MRLLLRVFPQEPEVMGLAALMLLQQSRAAARFDDKGGIILLEEQDRSQWDGKRIAEGLALIDKAMRHRRPGPYQVQAAIAALHARAKRADDTDWAQIDLLYANLERLQPSPVVTLNRAVAVNKVRGPAAALEMIEPLSPKLSSYFYFHGVKGALRSSSTAAPRRGPPSTARLRLPTHRPRRRISASIWIIWTRRAPEKNCRRCRGGSSSFVPWFEPNATTARRRTMTSTNQTPDEAAIRAVIVKRAAAISAKDAAGVLATEATDVVLAGLAPPLRFAGPASDMRKGMEAWFATWKGPIDYEVRDLKVTASDAVAFCTGFVRIGGTKTDGVKSEIWARQTIGLQKVDGTWKIVHDHHSVPFYIDGACGPPSTSSPIERRPS